jgi:hypothetical protein
MTNKRSTIAGPEINPADARRRQIRVAQMVFAGAATIATFALFSAAQPGDAGTAVASGSVPATAPVGLQAAPAGASPVVVDVDDGGVNDNGQTSGDIFTQNAQDQSTANGAGT